MTEQKDRCLNEGEPGRDVAADIYCAFRAYNEGEIDLEHWIVYLDDGLDQFLALFPDDKLVIDSLREIITYLETKVKEAKRPLLQEIKHLEGIIESLSNR